MDNHLIMMMEATTQTVEFFLTIADGILRTIQTWLHFTYSGLTRGSYFCILSLCSLEFYMTRLRYFKKVWCSLHVAKWGQSVINAKEK